MKKKTILKRIKMNFIISISFQIEYPKLVVVTTLFKNIFTQTLKRFCISLTFVKTLTQ